MNYIKANSETVNEAIHTAHLWFLLTSQTTWALLLWLPWNYQSPSIYLPTVCFIHTHTHPLPNRKKKKKAGFHSCDKNTTGELWLLTWLWYHFLSTWPSAWHCRGKLAEVIGHHPWCHCFFSIKISSSWSFSLLTQHLEKSYKLKSPNLLRVVLSLTQFWFSYHQMSCLTLFESPAYPDWSLFPADTPINTHSFYLSRHVF